ncbi:MAG: ABC transporter permease, partial [Eubacterium sp.]|nr:ABC transporter permease [Eubacterium sp.]
MIRVKNQKIITKISRKNMQANRVRNAAAITAIALTTMLFMTLFTIAGTMADTFQRQTFRLVGTTSHGFLKNLTTEQKELLETDPMIQEAGGRLFLGIASGEPFRKVQA